MVYALLNFVYPEFVNVIGRTGIAQRVFINPEKSAAL